MGNWIPQVARNISHYSVDPLPSSLGNWLSVQRTMTATTKFSHHAQPYLVHLVTSARADLRFPGDFGRHLTAFAAGLAPRIAPSSPHTPNLTLASPVVAHPPSGLTSDEESTTKAGLLTLVLFRQYVAYHGTVPLTLHSSDALSGHTSGGIPHLAKNERDVGHPAIVRNPR